MDERRYPGNFRTIPDDDGDSSRLSVTLDPPASQDSLSVCARSVGAFDLQRDDLDKLIDKPSQRYNNQDRPELELNRKRRQENLTSGRLAISGKLTLDVINRTLSPEEEQRADALDKLLFMNPEDVKSRDAENYLARLKRSDKERETPVYGRLTNGDKNVHFGRLERVRHVGDGQGDERSAVNEHHLQFKSLTKKLLGPQADTDTRDEIALLRSEVQKLTHVNSLLRKREESANSHVEQLEAEKADLVRSQTELQAAYDSLKTTPAHPNVEQQAAQQAASLDSLEQLLCIRDDSSQSQLSTIAEDHEGEKQIAALQEERDDIEKRLSTLCSNVEKEKMLRKAAEKERDSMIANIEQLQAELAQFRDENTRLLSKLHSLTTSIAPPPSNQRSKSPMNNKSLSGSDPQIALLANAQQVLGHHRQSSFSSSCSNPYSSAAATVSQTMSSAMSMPDIARQRGSSDTGFKSVQGERWGSGVSTPTTASLTQSSSVTSFQVLSPYGSESNLEQEQEMLVVSPEVQQSLADSLRGCSNMQQLIQAVLTYCSGVQSDRFRNALIEKERLQARLSKLESESDLLRLSLGECKDYAEYYSLISRQFEANNTILTACLYFTSRVVQIYEKVVGLLEADNGVMSVACRMAGVRNPHDLVGSTAKQAWGSSSSSASQENLAAARHAVARLRSADSEAKDLLQTFSMYATSSGAGSHLDVDTTGFSNKIHDNLLAAGSVNRQQTSSQSSGYASAERDHFRFYEDRYPVFSRTSSNSTTSSGGGTTTTAPSMVDVEAMREVISRLKDQAMGLKLQRTKREKSLVEVNTNAFPDPPRDLTYYNSQSQIERDFEHALLLLELATVKDDKVDLKAKNYLVEQELRSYELRLQTSSAQEQSYMVHIDHLKAELKEQTRKRRKMQRELRDLKERQQATESQDIQHTSTDSSTSSSLPLIHRTQSLPIDHPPPTDQVSHLQQDINEAERRERSLRLRNQELGETFEVYIKSHQEQTNQQQSYVNDLKKAYDSLVSAYNKLKKRFQVQQSSHEQEIAALRTELSVLQKTEEAPSQEDRLRYLELAQEETNL